MGNTSSQKGDRRERGLVTKAFNAGFGATRIPSSGAATDRPLPDVMMSREAHEITYHCACDGAQQAQGRLARTWSIEVKGTSDGTARIGHDGIFGLCAHARDWGSTPLIAVHPNYGDWGFFEPIELTIAPKSRGVTKAMLPGSSFEETFGKPANRARAGTRTEVVES